MVGRPELKSNLADSQLGSRGHLREQGACVHKARNVQFSQTVVLSNYKHVTVDFYKLIWAYLPSLAVGILGLTINTITIHVSHTRRDRLHITHQGESGHQKIKERRRGGAEESRLPSAAPHAQARPICICKEFTSSRRWGRDHKRKVGLTAVEVLIMHNWNIGYKEWHGLQTCHRVHWTLAQWVHSYCFECVNTDRQFGWR